MKYTKPKLKIVELKEDISACICGSNCTCSGGLREWWNWLWHGGCGCKINGSYSTNSIDEDAQEETQKSYNVWDNQW